MSVIVKAITSVAKAVLSPITKVVESIGGAVVDAIDWVVDEVVEPVLDAVGNTIEGFLDDPLMTIARVAAVASGQWWALPVVEGANTALNGGDLGDVLQTMAITAAAGQAGKYAGQFAGEYAAEVSTSLQYGTEIGSAQTAALVAQDVGLNALTTAVSSAVGAAAGSAAQSLVLGGDPLDAAGMALVNSFAKSATTELANTSSAYSKLSDSNQKIITDTAIALASGGNAGTAVINGIMSGLSAPEGSEENTAAKQEMSKFQQFIEDVSSTANDIMTQMGLDTPEEQAVITGAISQAFGAAFTGGNVSAAIDSAFTQQAAKQIGEAVVSYGTDVYNDIKTAYERATQAGEDLDATRTALEQVEGEATAYRDMVQGKLDAAEKATNTYNSRLNTYNSRVSKFNSLKATADAKLAAFNADNTNQAKRDAAVAAINAANNYKNTYVDPYYKDYLIPAQNTANKLNSALTTKLSEGGEYYETMQGFNESITALRTEAETQMATYEAANTLFEDSYDILGQISDDAVSAAKQTIVDAVTDSSFDAEYYADYVSASGQAITAEEAVDHFLEVGQYDAVPVNQEQESAAFKQYANLAMQRIAENMGVSVSDIDSKTLSQFKQQLEGSFTTSIGLRDAVNDTNFINSASNSLQQTWEFNESQALEQYLANNQAMYDNYTADRAARDLPALGYADGVTAADVIANYNDYTIELDADGNQVWTKSADTGVSVYNPATGAMGTQQLYDVNGETQVGFTQEQEGPRGVVTVVSFSDGTTYAYDVSGDGAFKEYDTTTGTFSQTSSDTSIKAAGVGSLNNDQLAQFVYDSLTTIDNMSEGAYQTFSEVVGGDPLGAVATAVDTIWEEAAIGEKAVKLTNDFLTWAETTSADEATSDFMRDTLGVVISGGGELLDAYVTAFDVLSDEGASDTMKSLAERMVSVGGDVHSDEYKQNLAEMQAIMGQGVDPDAAWYEQVAQQAMNVFEAAGEHPLTFLSEFVATELVQELPTILTFGAGKVLTVGAKAAGYTDDVAKWIGRTGTLSAEIVTEASEAFGATYSGAYDQIYNEAISNGFSATEANQLAEDGAIQSAWIATGAAMATMGVGGLSIEKVLLDKTPSNTMASVWDKIGDSTKQIVQASGKESISEALEEGFTEYTTGSYIQNNVNSEYNIIESTTTNALLGAITGGAVSGGVGTIGTVFGGVNNTGEAADVSFMNNIMRTYSPTYAASVDAAVASGDPAAVQQVLSNYGVTDSTTQLEITNQYMDSSTQTLAEVQAQAQANFDYFDFNPADLQQFTGTGITDQQTTTNIDAWVDPQYTDTEEVKAEARKEGLALTDEQAQQYVGQTTETDTLKTVLADADAGVTTREEAAQMYADQGYNVTDAELAQYQTLADLQNAPQSAPTSESIAQNYIKNYADVRMVTFDEAKAELERLGYVDPTDEQVQQFVGQANDALYQQNIFGNELATWYDEATTTEDEARAYFEQANGYQPTDEEVQQFVGQGDNTFDATNQQNLNAYVDPRQVTYDEASAMFQASNGYVPTEEELQQFVTQGGATHQTDTNVQLDAYVDPRQVTYTEAQQLFADENGYVPTEEELQQFIGQGGEAFQTDTTTQLGEYVDPRQVTYDEATEMFKAYTDFAYQPTPEEIQQFVGQGDSEFATSTNSTLDQYIDDNSVTSQEVVDYLKGQNWQLPDGVDVSYLGGQFAENTLPDVITENKDALTYNLLSSTMASYEAQGIARDEALQKGIDDLATSLGTTKEELLTALGETETTLLDRIEAGDTALSEQITGVETALTSDITDLATQLGTTEENLNTAISDLATQLGTTEDTLLEAIDAGDQNVINVLSQSISATEENLTGQITEVANLLGKPPEQVTQYDIDLVSGWVNTTQADPWSDYQLGYDVDGDGAITQADIDLMSNSNVAELAAMAPDSRYGNYQTLYGYNEQLNQDLQYQQEQNLQEQLAAQQQMEQNLQTQMDQNLQTQMNYQQQLAQQAQQQGNLNQMMSWLMQAQDVGGQQVSVSTPDPAKINYIYDFSSIFATPQQEGMFASPYAEGGVVNKQDDDDDELFRLLGV